MRVAYVLTEYPALTETFVTTEVALLRERGLEVVPLSLREPRLRGVAEAAAVPVATDPRALLRLGRKAPGAVADAVRFVRSQAVAPTEAAFAVSAVARAASMAETCRRLGVDHIHAHFERGAAILAALVGALTERPWSFTAHAFGLWTSDPDALRERVTRAAFVRAAHDVAAVTLRAMQTPTPIVRANTPVDPRQLPARTAGDGTLLAVARDVPKKGLDQLAELGELLRRRGVRLTPCAIGPSGRRLPGVRQLGALPHREALARMARASAVVAPARVAPGGDRDGLPLALIEAVSLGVPAFATRVAGIPELFGPHLGAHLADPEDTVALADRIAAAWAEPAALAERLDRAAADARRRYGPDTLVPLELALLGNAPGSASAAMPSSTVTTGT